MSAGTEAPTCYKESERKAKKEHKCCECNGLIQKGERYIVANGIWDNKPMEFKTCLDCYNLRNEVIKTLSPHDDLLAFEELAVEIENMREQYFIMRFNTICEKRKSELRIKK